MFEREFGDFGDFGGGNRVGCYWWVVSCVYDLGGRGGKQWVSEDRECKGQRGRDKETYSKIHTL